MKYLFPLTARQIFGYFFGICVSWFVILGISAGVDSIAAGPVAHETCQIAGLTDSLDKADIRCGEVKATRYISSWPKDDRRMVLNRILAGEQMSIGCDLERGWISGEVTATCK